MKKFVFLLLLLFAIGCTSQNVYKVGDSKVHVITEQSFAGPNTTMVFQVQGGETKPLNFSSGPGIGPSLIVGGSIVGAAYLFSSNLEPAETVINNSGSQSNSVSGAKSKSNSSAKATNKNIDKSRSHKPPPFDD